MVRKFDFRRYRKPDICISSLNNKIGIVKSLRTVGDSAGLLIPYEWLRKHRIRIKDLKSGDVKVIVQINSDGFLVVSLYNDEPIFPKEMMSEA